MEMPETRYARAGDVHIAYQVIGDGPVDIVLVPAWISHVEIFWEEASVSRAYERFASFARLIVFDKRGTGLSDPVVGPIPLEQRMDDVRAVMDAAGSERAVLLGVSEGGPMSMLFAASFPDRVARLVLYGTVARRRWATDYPIGLDEEEAARRIAWYEEGWGTGRSIEVAAPSAAHDEVRRRWFARLERQAASPTTVHGMLQMAFALDVRDVLRTIRVPTLVLHCSGDPMMAIENGRYLANHIPEATFVELRGNDHFPWWDQADDVIDEIEEFVTGHRAHHVPDRVLTTVLFTDIVGSTERAAALGDRAWSDLLTDHDRVVRRQFERFRGRERTRTGDGFLVTFDGPARAISCARALIDAARSVGLQLRAGLHTGEVELIGDDVGGMAVHIGARVAASAGPGEILVSRTVCDLVVGSGIAFEDRGVHILKGVPGEWNLHVVVV